MTSTIDDVRLVDQALAADRLDALMDLFPPAHFERLAQESFPFYRVTFWYPLERDPQNEFESIACALREIARPSEDVIGIEWWFSVLQTNKTPQWLLACHFDRNDLNEKDQTKLHHPEKASVLFLNEVPYGELVVTDQVLHANGRRPRQPKDMRFIQPQRNRYAIFPGNLYHGVIGRMWRPRQDSRLRVSMAVNYWTSKPKGEYLRDSSECMQAFALSAST